MTRPWAHHPAALIWNSTPPSGTSHTSTPSTPGPAILQAAASISDSPQPCEKLAICSQLQPPLHQNKGYPLRGMDQLQQALPAVMMQARGQRPCPAQGQHACQELEWLCCGWLQDAHALCACGCPSWQQPSPCWRPSRQFCSMLTCTLSWQPWR